MSSCLAWSWKEEIKCYCEDLKENITQNSMRRRLSIIDASPTTTSEIPQEREREIKKLRVSPRERWKRNGNLSSQRKKCKQDNKMKKVKGKRETIAGGGVCHGQKCVCERERKLGAVFGKIFGKRNCFQSKL